MVVGAITSGRLPYIIGFGEPEYAERNLKVIQKMLPELAPFYSCVARQEGSNVILEAPENNVESDVSVR